MRWLLDRRRKRRQICWQFLALSCWRVAKQIHLLLVVDLWSDGGGWESGQFSVAKMEDEWLSLEERQTKEQRSRIIQGDEDKEEEDGERKSEVGLYGYRRQALCLVLVGLLLLVVLNIGLSLWMLNVMEFSSAGLGPLTILRRGIQLHGEALVMDKLVASKITTRRGQPIRIESSQGISLTSRSYGKGRPSQLYNKLVLDDDQLQVYGSGVLISDPKGRVLFSADRKEVLVGAKQLKVTGEGGAVFHGSVQTPLVRSSAGNELRLESPTRGLNVFALHGVGVESRAGDISASCLKDFNIQSKAGAVKLDAHNVYLGKLPTAQIPGKKLPAAGEPVEEEDDHATSTLTKAALGPIPEVFQVCLCGGKGRVFLAPAGGSCVAEDKICY